MQNATISGHHEQAFVLQDAADTALTFVGNLWHGMSSFLATLGHLNQRKIMLSYAITFLIIALIAGVLGFVGIAGMAAEIAKVLFVIFLVLFVVSLIAGGRTPRL